jgi:hypothetical protein
MLSKYKPEKPFIMRTCNNHPQWYNQPLRLTEEQRKDPVSVLIDFFECYHLNDFRDLFWKWLVEVLSSSGSISAEALERGNHIFFYEKMEMLIEACYLIRKQAIEVSQKISPVILATG